MKKSTNKEVFEKFKSNLVLSLRFSAIITLIIVLIYALGVLVLSKIEISNSSVVGFLVMILFVSLLITVLVPFFYSYMAMNIVLNSPLRNEVKLSGFFKTTTIGFQRQVRRCIPVLKSVLFSIVAFIATMFGSLIFVYFYLGATSSEFVALIEQYVDLYYSTSATQEGLSAILSQVTSMIDPFADYIFLFSSFVAFFVFFRLMLRGIFKFYFMPISTILPDRVFNPAFKETIRTNRKEFNKNYRSIAWIYLVIYVVIFISSSYALLKLTDLPILMVVSTSGVLSLIFNLPFIPLIFNKYEEIIVPFTPYFIESTVERVNLEINLLKENYNMFGEGEREEADKVIASQEEIIRRIRAANFKDFTGNLNDDDDTE